MTSSGRSRTVLIAGASGSIGSALVARYRAAGCNVLSVLRHSKPIEMLQREGARWDLLVVASGTMEPIGPFMDADPVRWAGCIQVNALMPLAMLRALWPHRGERPAVCFFSGSGTNGPATNYSAYALSKILLIKAVELLHDELPELNAFVVGPGYVETKIHGQTLQAGERAGPGLAKLQRLARDGGTSMDNIFDCIEWCTRQGPTVTGGRNISVRDDAWRDTGVGLSLWLEEHPDRYRLRRHSNGTYREDWILNV